MGLYLDLAQNNKIPFDYPLPLLRLFCIMKQNVQVFFHSLYSF